MISAVSIAIMSSSFVGTTITSGPVVRVMRPQCPLPWTALRSGSRVIPRKPRSSHTFARTNVAFSPMPPVKTSASSRPSETTMPAAAFATE